MMVRVQILDTPLPGTEVHEPRKSNPLHRDGRRVTDFRAQRFGPESAVPVRQEIAILSAHELCIGVVATAAAIVAAILFFLLVVFLLLFLVVVAPRADL